MIWLFATLALAGSKWADRESNIVAEGAVDAPPSQVYRFLLQEQALERILPEDCATGFSYDRTRDPEAAVRLTYHAAAWQRRLDAVLEKSRPDRIVQYDHPGNKGFITRFTLAPVDAGTQVEVKTYINPPPWPFRKYYYTQVRPEWTQCYVDAIEQLDAQLGPAPAEEPTPTDAPAPAEEPAPAEGG